MRHFRLHIAILAAAALLGSGSGASAQSSNFLLGKWTETHAAILKELSESYVDSLPLDEIERKGIDAMLAGLDPYTVFIPAEENEDLQMMIQKAYGGIGAVIYKPDVDGNVIINEPYAGSPASKYGLSCGDEILSIDGETVHGLTSQQCSDKMKGDPGTSVNFSVKKVHSGDTVDVKVVRERIRIPDIEFAGMIDDTTGYILQTGFTEGVGGEMRTAVGKLLGQGMKTLVLDLRGNGGGLLDEAAEIVSIFLPKGSLVVTARGKEKSSNYTVTTTKAPLDPELEVIVLVDSGTASASEIVSGALQDTDRATIMGQRTFGKGLVQSIINLPYGGELKLTTAKYYTPSGRCVQAIDYSHRNEDGSVGHIPDSLTHEFKTAHGRTVRDGGGITPDVELEAAEFHFTDEDYEDFVAFAADEEFDYRSSAKALFDSMKAELDRDGLSEGISAQLDSLGKAVDIGKEEYLRLKKDEILPLIEEEIVVRYYFQEAGVGVRLRYDDALKQALRSERIPRY